MGVCSAEVDYQSQDLMMLGNGFKSQGTNTVITGGSRLFQNTSIRDLELKGGVLDLNGYELEVTGSFIQSGGEIY